jgi:hypothetical protein
MNAPPDGSSLKTWLDMSRLASTPCCETFDKWATRLRLACSRRQKRAHRTNGNGSSSWPTAKALTGGANSQREARGAGGADLQEAVETWPTPMAGTPARNGNAAAGNSDFSRRAEALAGAMETWQTPRTASGAYTRDRGQAGAERRTLEGQAAATWGTPRSSDAEKGGPNQSFGAGGTPLPAQAAQWPTPAARDHKGENGPDHLAAGTGRMHLCQLPNAVRYRFTPPAPETATHGRPSFRQTRALHRLLAEAGLFKRPSSISQPWTRPTRATPRNPARAIWRAAESYRRWSEKRRSFWAPRLSPIFVGSLMGWPPGHALCDCSETEFTRWQRHMRGALSALPMDFGPWIWTPPPPKPRIEQLEMF